MNKEKLEAFLDILKKADWKIEYHTKEPILSILFKNRFSKIPETYRGFLTQVKFCCNSAETVWFNCIDDFNGSSDSAFTWDEFEKQSLEASEEPDLRRKTQLFWDNHMPFLMSVKVGYAYLAIDLQSQRVVFGEEPEYEETKEICKSFENFIEILGNSLKDRSFNPKIDRFK